MPVLEKQLGGLEDLVAGWMEHGMIGMTRGFFFPRKRPLVGC